MDTNLKQALNIIERLIDEQQTIGLFQEAQMFIDKHRPSLSHTGGTWYAEGYYVKTDFPYGQVVAVCLEASGCNNAKSNAKLIAAAPELYQACLQAHNELRLNNGSQHVLTTLHNAMEKADVKNN